MGRICATLIVALVIGQAGVALSPELKNIAFAVFIFAGSLAPQVGVDPSPPGSRQPSQRVALAANARDELMAP